MESEVESHKGGRREILAEIPVGRGARNPAGKNNPRPCLTMHGGARFCSTFRPAGSKKQRIFTPSGRGHARDGNYPPRLQPYECGYWIGRCGSNLGSKRHSS
ncbi:hypothetical protein Scep_017125 [Stephania cephalantha]|uniref:Uncharacterized protein n=1 Tax=Stephania cephalantha TaxID=152367 RepID=A0AAP0NT99_9MAGN